MAGTYFEYHENRFPPEGSDADYLDRPFQPEKPPFDWHKVRQRMIGSFAIGCAVLAGYNAMNTAEKERIAATDISIDEVYPAADPAYDHAVTVTVGGVGHVSAQYVANQMEPLTERGRIWSLDFSDDGIFPELLARKLIGKMREEGITHISFYGTSNGGKVAVDLLANYILPELPNTVVEAVYTDSTPLDEAAIPVQRRREVDFVLSAIQSIPDAEYNIVLRAIGELYSRRDQFIDSVQLSVRSGQPTEGLQAFNNAKFLREVGTVIRYVIMNPDSASTKLLDSQYRYLLRTDTEADLLRLGELTKGSQRPVVVHIHAADAQKDSYVRVDDTVRRSRGASLRAGLTFRDVSIADMGHTLFTLSRKQIRAAFTDDIWPLTLAAVETAEERQARRTAEEVPDSMLWWALNQVDIDK